MTTTHHPLGQRPTTRLTRRTLLVLLVALGLLGTLLTGFFWALHLEKSIGMHYSFDVAVVSPLDRVPDLGQEDPTTVQYSTVTVVPTTHPEGPKVMEMLAVSSRYAVGLLACLTVAGLSVGLLRGRPFGRLSGWWLGAVGTLMVLVAVAEPWLSRTSVAGAVDALGLPTGWEATGRAAELATWVVPPAWDWTDTDWSLLVLGLVALVSAVLLHRAHRLEQDTAGLI